MQHPKLLEYAIPGTLAFSTSRQGGVSKGNYAEFNINRYCGDNESDIEENRRLLSELIAQKTGQNFSTDKIVMPHQVHGVKAVVVDEQLLKLDSEGRGEVLEGVDALITALPGILIGVSTADCIPLLFFDRQKRVAAAVHAGWRGTVTRIAEHTLQKMTECFGTQPADVQAVIGPGISLDAFEVGDEVYEQFRNAGFDTDCIARKYPAANGTEKWHIDLFECNRQQLVSQGLKTENIFVSGICTYSNSDRFFSARKLTVNSGRIFTAILIEN